MSEYLLHPESPEAAPPSPRRGRLRGWARRGRLEIAALLLVLVPVAYVVADDTFSDVPFSNEFHNDINALAGAGITRGCAPGLYCPGNPVTRQEMAAFLRRTGGRVAFNRGGVNGFTNTLTPLATVNLDIGGAAGGTVFVKVDGIVTAVNQETGGCPCEVQFLLARLGPPSQGSDAYYTTVGNATTGTDQDIFGSETASGSWVFQVPTNTTQTFILYGRISLPTTTPLPPTSVLQGTLIATKIPFGSTGGSTLAPEFTPPHTADRVEDLAPLRGR